MRNNQRYAWLGLGGNLGDVTNTLRRARDSLSQVACGELICSRLYRSAPWGLRDQPNFINQVVGLIPKITPDELLSFIQRIESEIGRERKVVWGPRNIDIDILCWPNQIRSDTDLIMPHPRLQERRFVLEPWAELAPNLKVPLLDQTVVQLLKSCPDSGWVEALSD